MDELYYDAIDLLKKLVSVPSPSREEHGAADVVEIFLADKGVSTVRSGNNVWAYSDNFSPFKPTILLNSHIDTVRPVDSWSVDPYVPLDDGVRITGLGSNDAGGAVVSLLAAFLFLRGTEQPYNLIFLASSEEEVSGKGGIESVIPQLPPISFAIVGEPTGMCPAVAEKGLMVLDCEVRGVSGHAARNEGENAIYKVLPLVERLRTAEFERVSEFLGPVKMSVTQIEGGTAHNVVPDSCRFVVDVRTTDAYTNDETLQMIASLLPGCDVKARSTRLSSSSIDANHPIVRRAVALGKEPFGSPTLSDQALLRCPSLKIGPGESARSHTADEFILRDEVREAIHTYITLLSGLEL